MKRLLSIAIAVSILVFWGSPGSTGERYRMDGFVKAMNPKMSSNLVKARRRGDSVCEWLVELQD